MFSGISTFGRLPYAQCLAAKSDVKYDIAFIGTCWPSLPIALPSSHLRQNREARETDMAELSLRCSFRHGYILPSRRTFRTLRHPPGISKVEPLVRCQPAVQDKSITL